MAEHGKRIITHAGACTSSKRKNQAMRRSEKKAKRRLNREG